MKFSEELKITCINSSDGFSKAKKNRFLKKQKGMVEGELEWLGYWSIVHLPSLLLVLNFVCSLGQGRFFPVILWLTFVPFFVLICFYSTNGIMLLLS
jgi:hypothetical protein